MSIVFLIFAFSCEELDTCNSSNLQFLTIKGEQKKSMIFYIFGIVNKSFLKIKTTSVLHLLTVTSEIPETVFSLFVCTTKLHYSRV